MIFLILSFQCENMFDNAVGNIVLYMLYCVIIRFVIVIFVIM